MSVLLYSYLVYCAYGYAFSVLCTLPKPVTFYKFIGNTFFKLFT